MIFRFALACFLMGSFIPPVFAGRMELTTYYPAPHGEYQTLEANGADANNANVALRAGGTARNGLVVTNADTVGIGTGATPPIGVLELASTTAAFYPPRMTALQRNAIATDGVADATRTGAVIYNEDSDRLEVWNGSQWNGATSNCRWVDMPVVLGRASILLQTAIDDGATGFCFADLSPGGAESGQSAGFPGGGQQSSLWRGR